MRPGETIGTDAAARRLLRRAKLCRVGFLPRFLKRRGHQASEELQAEARRGNLAVLRVLAQPTPHPDHLLGLVWRDLLGSQQAASSLLRRHVYRPGGGYEAGSVAAGRKDQVSRDLARLVRHPAPDELTAGMRRIVAVAAALRDHPVAEIARSKILAADDQGVVDEVCALAEFVPDLADFCRDHELAPSDPARRPVFWLLTAQYARYRPADPYGAAALAAYASADQDAQARLRTAAISGGLFELLRLMAETGGEFADLLHGEQFTELSEGLANNGRWSLLWELLTQVPPAVAVERSLLFPDDWRPSSPADQRLLTELRAAPADLVKATAADPSLLGIITFEHEPVLLGVGRSRAAAFSLLPGQRLGLEVYDVPEGRLVGRREYPAAKVLWNAVVCGDEEGTVVAALDEGLYRCTADNRIPLLQADVSDLTATAVGWAGLTKTELLIGSHRGGLERRVGLSDLGIEPGEGSHAGFAVSADGTRLALADDHTIVVVDQDGGLIGTTRSDRTEPIGSLGFLGDGIVTTHQQWIEHRLYQVYSTNDYIETWDDVTVRIWWNLIHWSLSADGDLRLSEASSLPSLSHEEEFMDTQTAFTSYGYNVGKPRIMSRDNRDPGNRGAPRGTHEQPRLDELPSSPPRLRISTSHEMVQLVDTGTPHVEQPRWMSTREKPVIPGSLVFASHRPEDHELRLYDVRREHDEQRGAVLALLNRPMPQLQRADLETLLLLDQDDPCLRVLRACLAYQLRD